MILTDAVICFCGSFAGVGFDGLTDGAEPSEVSLSSLSDSELSEVVSSSVLVASSSDVKPEEVSESESGSEDNDKGVERSFGGGKTLFRADDFVAGVLLARFGRGAAPSIETLSFSH